MMFMSSAPFGRFQGEAPTPLKVEYFYLSYSQFHLHLRTQTLLICGKVSLPATSSPAYGGASASSSSSPPVSAMSKT